MSSLFLCVVAVQKLVRARESPQCAVCEFVMKEIESIIQDQTTEVQGSAE